MPLIPDFIHRRIAHRPNLLKIVDNIGWLFIDRVLRMGVGLFVGVWFARYLGPEQFGQYSYAIAFVTLFGAFASLGLNAIVIRDIVRDPDDAGVTLGTAFALKLAAGLLAFTLVVGTIFWLHPDDGLTKAMVAILGLTLVFKSSEIIKCWFESQVQSRYIVWVGNGVFLLIASVKILMIVFQAPLIAFAWVVLADAALVAIGIFTIYGFKVGGFHQWTARLDRAAVLLKQSWPMILSTMAIMIQARIDQIMLGNMLGNEEVGQYSAAMRLIEAFAFAPVIIASTLAPSITQAKATSEQLYESRLIETYRIMFVVFLAMAIPIFFLGEKVTVLIFGTAYERAGGLLSLFAIRLLFNAFGLVRSHFITNEGMFRYALFTSVIGALLNIGLNYALIPSLRSEGALIATIISFFITIFLIDFFYKSTKRNIVWILIGIVTSYKLFSRIKLS